MQTIVRIGSSAAKHKMQRSMYVDQRLDRKLSSKNENAVFYVCEQAFGSEAQQQKECSSVLCMQTSVQIVEISAMYLEPGWISAAALHACIQLAAA